MAIIRLRLALLPVISGFLLLAGSAQASTILDNFESNSLAGWTLTGDAWAVGGATGSSPNITPAEGSYFARSGAPNTAGESATGTATSSAFTVTWDTLSWQAAGWSGPADNGNNYFQVLDSGFNVLATIHAPETDAWTGLTTDLLADGLHAGDTFYFRAVDSDSNSGYSWIAMDNLQLTGAAVSAEAPEPGTGSMIVLCLAGAGFVVRKRAQAV
jgi:hypothetical protein